MTNNSSKYEHILSSGFTRSYYVTQSIKYSKSNNSYRLCLIKMVAQQAQLRVMTNNHTKYEQIMSYGFRGAAFTKSYGQTTEIIKMSKSAGQYQSHS